MKSWNTKRLAAAAVIAAAYAALTMAFAAISYESLQFRFSEALCVLPFFFPPATWGLFVGCIIANLISVAGLADIIFGSLATLLSCLCISAIGKGYRKRTSKNEWERGGNEKTMSWMSCIAACAMPVLINAPIIGAMLAVMFPLDEGFWKSFAVFAAEVAFGEIVVMYVLGLPLMRYIPKLNGLNKMIDKL